MSTLFGKNEYRALIIKSFGQQNNNSFWMIRCQSCQMMTFLIMLPYNLRLISAHQAGCCGCAAICARNKINRPLESNFCCNY